MYELVDFVIFWLGENHRQSRLLDHKEHILPAFATQPFYKGVSNEVYHVFSSYTNSIFLWN